MEGEDSETMSFIDSDKDTAELFITLKKYMEDTTSTKQEGLVRVNRIFSAVSEMKGSHKLLRYSRTLARTIGRKGDELLRELVAVKSEHPELETECETTAAAIHMALMKYHALMKSEYDFRRIIRKPNRFA